MLSMTHRDHIAIAVEVDVDVTVSNLKAIDQLGGVYVGDEGMGVGV